MFLLHGVNFHFWGKNCMKLKKLNIAEFFSLVRVITFPLLLYFTFVDERYVVAWLFIILFSTDFIDGFFAKFFKMESDRRAKLDSLGDVLFFISGIIGFYQFENQYFIDNFIFIAISGGLYLSVFIISLIKFGKPVNFHTYTAKITAVFLVVFLAYVLFFGGNDFLFFLAFTFSVIETIEEIIIIQYIDDWNANIPGLWFVIKNKNMDKK